MRYLFVFLYIFFFNISFSADLKKAVEANPWNNKRVYYVVERFGLLRERGHFVRRLTTYQKKPCLVYLVEKTTVLERDGQRFTQTSKVKSITGLNGDAYYRQEQFVGSLDKKFSSVSIDNGRAVFFSEDISSKDRYELDVPAEILFDINPEYIIARNPRVGLTLSASVLDISGRSIVTETVKVIERRPASSVDGVDSLWVAESSAEGRPTLLMYFTDDGRLLRLETEGLVYRIVTKEEFEASKRANVPVSKVVTSLPIGAYIPAWDGFSFLRFLASPSSDWLRLVSDSPYARLDISGDNLFINLLRNAPKVDSTTIFPMPVPDSLQPYLVVDKLATPQNKKIINAARYAITDRKTGVVEKNVLRAVSYLAGWVNETVKFLPRSQINATPVVTLERKEGDCTEHAYLFVSLARSLGIPARVCQGLIVQSDRAVYHAWSEVWISGVWIPVDTTVSRVGLPAGYLLTSRADFQGEVRDDFAWSLQQGVLSLQLLSAGKETPNHNFVELIVGDKQTYAFTEGNWLSNLYWGFSLYSPPEWRGNVKMDAVELVSPDNQASVKCEALAGDFRAGERDLLVNVNNLRKSLSKFKLISSKVVSFDDIGSTPALFIDFTCVEDGQSLRCRQYIIPRRQRAFRLSFWSDTSSFSKYSATFDEILSSFDF